MRKGIVLVLLCLCFLGTSATTALALPSFPWPDHGSVNVVSRTITLDYGQAAYDRPQVTGFPKVGYADVWVGSSYSRVNTPAGANALLMAPQYRNRTVRVVAPYRDIDVAGKVFVRHAVSLNRPAVSGRELSVTGRVKPAGRHKVAVRVQRKILGVWVTRQKQVVTTNGRGSFEAVFSAKKYNNRTYRVTATVSGDSVNARGQAIASR